MHGSNEFNINGLTITNGRLNGESAFYGVGGGIHADEYSTVTIAYCTISGNQAEDDGDGIFMGPESYLNITSGTITGNNSVYGGGIYIETGSELNLSNSSISKNQAEEAEENIELGSWTP